MISNLLLSSKIKTVAIAVFSAAVIVACSPSEREIREDTIDIAAANTAERCSPDVHPERWPKQTSPITRNDSHETKIQELLARMTLEEKVGQVIQAGQSLKVARLGNLS